MSDKKQQTIITFPATENTQNCISECKRLLGFNRSQLIRAAIAELHLDIVMNRKNVADILMSQKHA